MTKIIDGKSLSEKIKDRVAKEIYGLGGPRPNLAIILVGDREDSNIYVNLKEREAKKVGVDTHTYRCEAKTSEREIFEMIDLLNNDDLIDAILVQLPLPDGFDTDGIIRAISPEKDVDRFHPDNLEKLFKTCDREAMPPVHEAVLELLAETGEKISGKKACVVANSDIFGKSLAKALACQGCEAEKISPDDPGLAGKTRQADILVTAVGRPGYIKKEHVKKDALVIDIGISKVEGKVRGDVDFDDVDEQAGYVSPVPGGVGPMTIAMLFKNTLVLYKSRHQKKGDGKPMIDQ